MRLKDVASCSFASFNGDLKEQYDDRNFCGHFQRPVYLCGTGTEQEQLALGDPGYSAADSRTPTVTMALSTVRLRTVQEAEGNG